jgi:hypothetical protein
MQMAKLLAKFFKNSWSTLDEELLEHSFDPCKSTQQIEKHMMPSGKAMPLGRLVQKWSNWEDNLNTAGEAKPKDQVPTCEAHRQLTGCAACTTSHTGQGRVTKVTWWCCRPEKQGTRGYKTFSQPNPSHSSTEPARATRTLRTPKTPRMAVFQFFCHKEQALVNKQMVK